MSTPNENYLEITYEDGTKVRVPHPGAGLLHLAGDGVLDWIVDLLDPGPEPQSKD